jgi:hypothetical protein
MESSKITSPQRPEMNDDTTDAPIHQISNGLTRKCTTTTPVITAGATTGDIRYSETQAIETRNPDNTHGRSTESPMEEHKLNYGNE